MAEAAAAGYLQLATWMRSLRSPNNLEETAVINLIGERFRTLGGWQSGLSKAIGW